MVEEGLDMMTDPQDETQAEHTVSTEEEDVPVTTLAPAEPVASSHADENADVVVIGGNCQVKGEIRNCRRLEIEGELEGDLETGEIVVREGGRISGNIKAHSAEIHGNVDGILLVEDLLDIHESGIVDGEINYGKLSVASGGQLVGTLKQAPIIAAAWSAQKKRPAAITFEENPQSASISKLIDGLMHGKE